MADRSTRLIRFKNPAAWLRFLSAAIVLTLVCQHLTFRFQSQEWDLPPIAAANWSADMPSHTMRVWSSLKHLLQDPQRNFHSSMHCVGDNFLPNTAWIHRSCHYRDMCWNLQGTFRLVRSQQHRVLLDAHMYMRVSTLLDESYMDVSLIGMTRSWMRKSPGKYKWRPTVVDDIAIAGIQPTTQYVLSITRNTTMVPIALHPSIMRSPLKLLMDVHFAIFNLLTMFGKSTQHDSVIVIVTNPSEVCDPPQGNQTMSFDLCQRRMQSLFRIARYHVVVADDMPTTSEHKSDLWLCGDALAGIGMLTDHGMAPAKKRTSRNVGRGRLLWDFSHHLREQFIHFDTAQSQNERGAAVAGGVQVTQRGSDAQHSVICTIAIAHVAAETDAAIRARSARLAQIYSNISSLVDTSTQVSPQLVAIEDHATFNRTIMKTASQSNIWVAHHDDEATLWPAFFLPKHAILVLLYDQHPSQNWAKAELWNHISHLRIVWVSVAEAETELADLLQRTMTDDNKRTTDGSKPATWQSMDGNNGISVPSTNDDTAIQPISHLVADAHCIGENWNWDSRNYRSCHMRNLCLDTSKTPAEFVTFVPQTQTTAGGPRATDAVMAASEVNVMIGHSVRLAEGGPWSPTVRTLPLTDLQQDGNAIVLSPDIVMIPIYTQQPNINNPGHLMWDYLLAIYNLVTMFHLDDRSNSSQILLVNTDPTCVETANNTCHSMVTKFLALLGVAPEQFINAHDDSIQRAMARWTHGNAQGRAWPSIVCSQRAMAGIGMLTDHGFKKHGQLIEDYRIVHNVGRASTIWEFRRFALQRMSIPSTATTAAAAVTKSADRVGHTTVITFSILSSNNSDRRRDFAKHIECLQRHVDESTMKDHKRVHLQTVEMHKLPLREQLESIQQSHIFITVMGGSASIATFLNRDCSLVIFFADASDVVKGKDHMPTMMDYDLWNNAAHLRVHWLPLQHSEEASELDMFVALIDLELQRFVGV